MLASIARPSERAPRHSSQQLIKGDFKGASSGIGVLVWCA